MLTIEWNTTMQFNNFTLACSTSLNLKYEDDIFHEFENKTTPITLIIGVHYNFVIIMVSLVNELSFTHVILNLQFFV